MALVHIYISGLSKLLKNEVSSNIPSKKITYIRTIRISVFAHYVNDAHTHLGAFNQPDCQVMTALRQ